MNELTMENQWTLCSKNFGSRYLFVRSSTGCGRGPDALVG